MSKSLVVRGSLADIMQTEGKSLAESFLSCDAILIVDTSGSMGAKDAPGGLSRHEAAQKELERLQASLPGKLAVVSFSNEVQFCPTGIPVRFNGGTDMAKALRFIKPADNCGIRFFMITDGQPDSEREVLEVAKMFQSRIDCVYIGPEDGGYWDGRKFLEKLAELTGGQHVKSEQIGMLANSVERLLLTG